MKHAAKYPSKGKIKKTEEITKKKKTKATTNTYIIKINKQKHTKYIDKYIKMKKNK